MIRNVVAVLIIVGATYAFPSENEGNLGPTKDPEDVPLILGRTHLNPEKVTLPPVNAPLAPEDRTLSSGNIPAAPGSVPLNADSLSEDLLIKNGPLPADLTKKMASKDGLKSEGVDLKTDATFWWPFYRSFYRYPYYRYYRPRVYRYYYW